MPLPRRAGLKITPGKQNAYYYPLANPAEGFPAMLFHDACLPGDSACTASRSTWPGGRLALADERRLTA